MITCVRCALAGAMTFCVLLGGPALAGPTLYQRVPSGVGQYEHDVPGAPPATTSTFSFDKDHFLCSVGGGGKAGAFNMVIHSTEIFAPGPEVTDQLDGSRLIRMAGNARTISLTTLWPGLDFGKLRSILENPTQAPSLAPGLVKPEAIGAAPGVAEDLPCSFIIEAIDNDGVMGPDGKPKPDHFDVTIYGSQIFRDMPGRTDGGWTFGGEVFAGDVRAHCPATPDPLGPCSEE